MPCSLARDLQDDESTQSSTFMGGMNYHIDINFEDGTIWLARIRRRDATTPPLDLQRYILRSEIAILQFLGKTNVPVPKIYDYNLDDNNPVGVDYVLYEKLPGKTGCWPDATTEKKQKLMRQLADIYIELQKYPSDGMGSLESPGTYKIGPFAKETHTDYVDFRMHPIGPFIDTKTFLRASIEQNIDRIQRGAMYSSRPIDGHFIHRFLVDTFTTHISLHQVYEYLNDGHCYLRHADDKGDHILVDDDYNITDILDWEWAYTDQKPWAFTSPMMLLDVNEFYIGKLEPSADEEHFTQCFEENGRSDLAQIVRKGRMLHFFRFCNGHDLTMEFEGFEALFYGLGRALGVENDKDGNAENGFGWDEWRKTALREYKDDDLLKEFLAREYP
ncbi:uncharacterized protein BDV14DRAFT_196588 [Aspergillus stella-maris]|uniref:uncharacterized protein n=1 Tax=Aspergillus stella-maris TaxID=1810926 RepID=UPI003CCD23DA